MKAFFIACILLATVVFSPLSSCTARELAVSANVKGYGVVDLAVGNGALAPGNIPFNCGRGNRYCVPSPPKTPCLPYKRDC
ncbi:hypothetical protein SADUNF_Sadunf17G0104500 [Salix dunnii]|uniref:Uncharacterized protein n=1 Tax=Salix dunnii TaxID=1413687 RepID=A0A835J6I2_9ROSI|nr:hypothetical protein SADUNF_Sadunf17G0104500 [Salix dunnii]